MSDEPAQQSSFLTQLSAIAWVLALVAAATFVRLLVHASSGDAAVEPAQLVWLAACVLSGCFSVGAFLLVAVKRAEARTARLIADARAVGAPTRS